MDYNKLDTLQLLTLKIAYTDILLQMHKNIRKIDNKLDELDKEKKKQ
jgi:DNA polymerase III delta prime subunit